MKKALVLLLVVVLILPIVACRPEEIEMTSETTEDIYEFKYQKYATMSPEEIVAELTLEQKAAQMVQPILYNSDIQGMQDYCYGSIYGDEGVHTAEEWSQIVDDYQKAAIESEPGIPFLLAQDDVHGVGYCVGAVYFPHNIGIGAANDEELAYQVGLITANEAKQCHMMWNLYPCVAQSVDPRWGRTYECYSSDIETIKRLSTAYTRGLVDGGVVACSKHFFGDGNVVFGTGDHEEYSYLSLIDRGDASLSEEEINELLSVYQAQIDAGVQTIMVSYSSLNGVKMHENAEFIWKLKNEMGFEGFVVSDSMAIQYTSPDTYEEQVITAINSGIDMLMEGEKFAQARQIIVDSVENGKITAERVDDAVTRIIKVKKDVGLFDDPFCQNISVNSEVGSSDSRAVAEQLVEESLVLLKNDNNTLPIKEGSKVVILGPAADNRVAQVGGWTLGWNKSPIGGIDGVTTIKKAFMNNAEEYGIEVITDPNRFDEADVIILCIGEESYAEWFGDTTDLSLNGNTCLTGNMDAIYKAREYGKPVVTCIVAGRQLFLGKSYYDNWDSVVMCYLPGSEGKGVSDVLCGYADFTGRLPSPWYGSNRQIIGLEDCVFEKGYGLSYGEGFVPRT
ncbi:MAG: glycoside hydrolase family 3 protein [Clostridiales bacterium]|nr:glycoside hydrolase family 3 protein [Clostridiales bacterium]